MKLTLYIIIFIFTIKVAIANSVEYDLNFLKSYASHNPHDIRVREILLKYYKDMKDKQNVIKYSKQLYKLDPKNRVVLELINNFITSSRVAKYTKDDISKVLHKLIKDGNHIGYLNFYQALLSLGRDIPKKSHIDALYSAIILNRYAIAQDILQRDDISSSPYLSKITEMLNKKLATTKRVIVN
jgi:hypothetical protein